MCDTIFLKTIKGRDLMQIALTKKLADGLKLKPQPAVEEINPLFKWTANSMTTWDNRHTEDMLIASLWLFTK